MIPAKTDFLKTFARITAAAVLFCSAAAAQTEPAFDVTSVKPLQGGAMSLAPTLTPRRITWTTDLYYLNSFAWNIPFTRINGIHSQQVFRIEATTSHDATVDEMRRMTRTLLATRFKQKAHIISKEVEGIALVVGKDGLKIGDTPLQESDKPYVSGVGSNPGVTTLISHRASMEDLAARLAILLGEPVWNRTGLTGTYDFTFRYSRDGDPAVNAPSLEYALRHQLGINLLKKQRGLVNFLVVDFMNDDPGEN
jgi:uncharacterized protein (TIGR03435 family)